MKDKFKNLVDKSQRILITAHISPDPDAVASVLLLGTTLRLNYPDKQVEMALEEKSARDISFLDGYDQIKFEPLLEATQKFKPDLFVLLDAPNFERCSRFSGQQLRELLKNELRSATVIIDHHEELGRDDVDVYINDRRPATAQEIYEILFEQMGLKEPTGYEQVTLLGIVSDTARHKFDNPVHRQTFRIVSDLIDAGASIEELENKTGRFSKPQLEVLNNLISHVTDSGKGYTYSFVDDNFTKNWLKAAKPIEAFKLGFEEFSNQFIRKFENNLWGFAIYPDLATGEGVYGVSLRSATGIKDVSEIAHQLGGGGHKPAAGAKIKATGVQDALKKVEQAIAEAAKAPVK